METNKITTISVVLASYNGSRYIKEQLDSLDRQTVLPNELIISDDNSSDSTLSIIEEWAKNSRINNIKIFSNTKGKGCNANFNQAILYTTGDYVFICDQDDVWYDDKIEKMSSFIKANNSLLSIHDLEFCDEFLNKVGIRKISRIRDLYRQDVCKFYVTGMATVVQGSFLRKIVALNSKAYAYDNWISDFSYYLKGKTINEVVFADYRRHDSNATKDDLVNSMVHKGKIDFLKRKIFKTHKFNYNESIAYKSDLLRALNEFDTCDNHDFLPLFNEISLLNLRKKVNESKIVPSMYYAFHLIFEVMVNKYDYKLRTFIRDMFYRK